MIKVGILYITLFAVPLMMGMLYNRLTDNNIFNAISNWVNGFVIALGLFQVIVLPSVFLKWTLDAFTYIYSGVIIAITIISFWLNRKDIYILVKTYIHKPKKIYWELIIALIIIGFQCYMYFFYQHTDADDAYYVAAAVTAVDTNTLFEINPYTGNAYDFLNSRYILSPFPLFHAYLSNLFKIHAAILAHTVLPVVYIFLAYGVVYLLGLELFSKDTRRSMLLVVVSSLIATYFPTSVYTQSSFMLWRIWQGKAFLASVLLPHVFGLGYRIVTQERKKKDWILLLMTMLACCLVSSMGIMLGAISVGIIALINWGMKKRITELIYPLLCCIPNVVLAITYLLM